MALAYEVMAANGKYTQNGEEKTRWTRVGAVFEKNGNLSIKLDAIPVGTDWDGWLRCFEPRAKEEKPQAPRTTKVQAGFDDMPDDIPF